MDFQTLLGVTEVLLPSGLTGLPVPASLGR